MKKSKGTKWLSALIATLLCVQMMSSGLVIFAGSMDHIGAKKTKGIEKSEAEVPAISAFVNLDTDILTDSTEGQSDEGSESKSEPQSEAFASATETETTKPVEDTKSETEKPDQTVTPESSKPAMEESKPEAEKPAGEQKPESSVATEESKPAEESSTGGAKPTEESGLEAEKPTEEVKSVETDIVKEKHPFIIYDPYVLMNQEVSLGSSNNEKKPLFKVTYEKDGDIIEVKDGDRIEEGTVVTIAVTPEEGPFTYLINDVEQPETPAGDLVTTEVTYEVVGFTRLSAEAAPARSTFGVTTAYGGGTYTGSVSNTAELTTALNASRVVSINQTWHDTPVTNGGFTNYTQRTSTDTYNLKYDDFLITVPANVVVELDLATLAGRDITFDGDGIVIILANGANQTLQDYTTSGAFSETVDFTGLTWSTAWGANNNPIGSRTQGSAGTSNSNGAAGAKTDYDATVNTKVTAPKAQTITFDGNVKISSDKVYQSRATGIAPNQVGYFSLQSAGTITGVGLAHKLVFSNNATTHQSLKATGSTALKVQLHGNTFRAFDMELTGDILTGYAGLNLYSTTNQLSVPAPTGNNIVTTWDSGQPNPSKINIANFGTSATYGELKGGAITIAGGAHTIAQPITGTSLTVKGSATVNADAGVDVGDAISVESGTKLLAQTKDVRSGSASFVGELQAKDVTTNGPGSMSFSGTNPTITGKVDAGEDLILSNSVEVKVPVNASPESVKVGGLLTVGVNAKLLAESTVGGAENNVIAGSALITGLLHANDFKTTTGEMRFNGQTPKITSNIIAKTDFILVGATVTANKGVWAGKGVKTNQGSTLNALGMTIVADGVGAERSSVAGAITADIFIGQLAVASTATGTINELYAKGYGNLASNSVAYNKVFGGGTSKSITSANASEAPTNSGNYGGGVTLTISGADLSDSTDAIYGGGDKQTVGNITYTITGGTFNCNLYGGSLDGGAGIITFKIGDVGSGGTAKINDSIYGGGHAVAGDANSGAISLTVGSGVTLLDGTSAIVNIYGGGHAKTDDAGATSTNVVNVNSNTSGSVYGGGHAVGGNANVSTSSAITVGVVNIGGSVFGGGHAPTASQTATVGTGGSTATLNGTTLPTGSVYGGGFAENGVATIAGNSNATLTNATVALGSVYGGGYGQSASANISGNSAVSLNGATITAGNVYGGGLANTSTAETLQKASVISTNGTTVGGTVYGGGHGKGGSAKTGNESKVTLTNTAVTGSVYGGGYSETSDASVLAGGSSVTTLGGCSVGGTVYGGGHAKGAKSSVEGEVKVDMTGTNVTESVYGGGFGESVEIGADATATAHSIVTIRNSTVGKDVYGGGHAKGSDAKVTKTVTMTIYTGTTNVGENIYGGGHADGKNADIGSDVTISLSNVNIAKSLYGGGNGDLTGDANVKGNIVINLNDTDIAGSFYGGGNGKTSNSIVGGTPGKGNILINTTATQVGVTSGTGAFHGGGLATGADADVKGNVTIILNTTDVQNNFHGGGLALATGKKADVAGDITITQNSGTISGNFYGGGQDAPVGGKVDVTTIAGSTIKGSLHGGGIKTVLNNSDIGKTVILNLDNTIEQDVYGGGIKSAVLENNTPLASNIAVGIILGTNSRIGLTNANVVHGGGQDAIVNGTVNITQVSGSIVYGSLYGGGHKLTTDSDIQGNIVLELDGLILHNVYGGGLRSAVNNKTNRVPAVDMKILEHAKLGSGLTNIVHGGGQEAIVIGHVHIDTAAKSVVEGTLYGGGNGVTATDSQVTGNTKIDIAGIVKGDVFGGGIKNAPIKGYTTVTIDNLDNATGHVVGSVYGGGADRTSPVEGQNTAITGSNGKGASTNVIIKANIGRNVYGGGADSAIKYNSKVTLTNATYTIAGTVFGAGVGTGATVEGVTAIDVQGSVDPTNEVTILGDGSPVGAIFGGGTAGSTVANAKDTNNVLVKATTVMIKGGDIRKNVYGGGEKTSAGQSNILGSTYVEMTKGKVHTVPEGQNFGSVYGGGYDSEVTGNTKVIIGALSAPAKADCYVQNDVYGGGYGLGGIVRETNGTDVWIREFGLVGRVFGGGQDGASILGSKGTKVLIDGEIKRDVFGGGYKADLTAAAVEGTNVTISAIGIVNRDVFGGGLECDVLSQNTTDVMINGYVKRNVYGGGHDGDVTQPRGTNVTVTGSSAVVGDKSYTNNVTADYQSRVGDVYGGGFGENTKGNVQQTTVAINNGATVQHSVFGGGRGKDGSTSGAFGQVANNTNVEVTGATTVVGLRDKISMTNNADFTLDKSWFDRGETDSTSGLGRGTYDTYWTYAGNVYGGGRWATVGGDTTVNIHDMDQKAFNRVSGGNLGMESANAVRNVFLTNLGVGFSAPRTVAEQTFDDLTNKKYYTDKTVYTAIRFLQDYQTANSTDSYLTVYYNLKTNDDGKNIHGANYTNDYNSTFNVTRGTYHVWRPRNHTVIRVEPKVVIHDYAKFRMEADYSITFDNDIITTNQHISTDNAVASDLITILIDPVLDANDKPVRKDETHAGSTSKVYGPNDAIKTNNTFDFQELLRTYVVENLQDELASWIVGINIYVPPIAVGEGNVTPTNPGGISKPDSGSNGGGGKTGSGGGGGGGGGAAVKGTNNITGKSPIAPSTRDYYSDDKVIVNKTTTVKKAQTALATNKNIMINEKKAGQVAGDTLKALSIEAAKVGGKITYQGDTITVKNVIEGRMYIDTSKVSGVKEMIHTGVYTSNAKIARTQAIFGKFFANKFAVVNLSQQSAFGTTVRIAARVDLSKLNTKTLYFYVYSAEKNQFTQIQDPQYVVDANGFVHFNTSIGGDVVITETPLKRR